MGLALGAVVATLSRELPTMMAFRVETTAKGKAATVLWSAPDVTGTWDYWVQGVAAPNKSKHTSTVTLASKTGTSGSGDAVELSLRTSTPPRLTISGSHSAAFMPVKLLVVMKKVS